jgi:serralysin
MLMGAYVIVEPTPQPPMLLGAYLIIDDTVDAVFNQDPVVDSEIIDVEINAYKQFEYIIPEDTFSDPDGDDLTWSATLDNGDPLPSWLTFDPDTRKLSGFVPKDADGTLNIKVSVDDGR